MLNLRYSCLFAKSGVQHILCCVALFCLRLVFCVPNVASVSLDFLFSIAFYHLSTKRSDTLLQFHFLICYTRCHYIYNISVHCRKIYILFVRAV
jgi:hypothetical protein